MTLKGMFERGGKLTNTELATFESLMRESKNMYKGSTLTIVDEHRSYCRVVKKQTPEGDLILYSAFITKLIFLKRRLVRKIKSFFAKFIL